MSPVQSLIASHRQGRSVGLYSVCCSNELVLRAAMDVARRYDTLLLIEATSNQVDQFGGYTGMTPPQYRDYVLRLAREEGFPANAWCSAAITSAPTRGRSARPKKRWRMRGC